MKTEELRQLQEQQADLMHKLRALFDKPNRDFAQIDQTDEELIMVSITYATAFLDAHEAKTITADEYAVLAAQNLEALKVSKRAKNWLRRQGRSLSRA